MAGIVGYGAYVPRRRIETAEIARQWGKDPETIRKGLMIVIVSSSWPGTDLLSIIRPLRIVSGSLPHCRAISAVSIRLRGTYAP